MGFKLYDDDDGAVSTLSLGMEYSRNIQIDNTRKKRKRDDDDIRVGTVIQEEDVI